MPMPSADITAIFVPSGQGDENVIARKVLSGPYGDVWLRIKPLPSLGLTQIELFDAAGQMRVDPAMVMSLSADDGQVATFVHVNRAGSQALVHAFKSGREVEGWLGTPDEVDERTVRYVGHTVDQLVAADDGSRVHPAIAASSTMAIVRGRPLAVPAGLPIALGTFGFHDSRTEGEGQDEGDRVALVAFDPRAVRAAWEKTPGAELAARVRSLPDRVVGPLLGAREAVVAELAALGDRSPVAAELRSVRALELVALSESYVFSAGEQVRFVDERMLPLFSLADSDPPLDEDEAAELEEQPSVLAAMVEALPYSSPEGHMLEQIDDAEVQPLAPWAVPGAEYVGAMFVLSTERLRPLLGTIDQQGLAFRIDRFYRGWWKAMNDEPWGEEYKAWRAESEKTGAADVERFLALWTEWRVVFELASRNGLTTAMVFYG